MANTKNISPDSRVLYLLELQIAQQKKILAELDRLNERFDRIEAYVGMTEREKNKPNNVYTTSEVTEILSISRNTLQSYRKKASIELAKPGNKYYYSTEDINKLMAYKKKMT